MKDFPIIKQVVHIPYEDNTELDEILGLDQYGSVWKLHRSNFRRKNEEGGYSTFSPRWMLLDCSQEWDMEGLKEWAKWHNVQLGRE